MLDALIHRQDGQITGPSKTAVVENLPQVPQHCGRTVRLREPAYQAARQARVQQVARRYLVDDGAEPAPGHPGGGTAAGGIVEYGKRLKVRLPAKRVPEAVERWIRMYEAERNEGEPFLDYAERVDTSHFEEHVKDLTLPIEFSLESMNYFIDWSRSAPFEVIRGEGECAI